MLKSLFKTENNNNNNNNNPMSSSTTIPKGNKPSTTNQTNEKSSTTNQTTVTSSSKFDLSWFFEPSTIQGKKDTSGSASAEEEKALTDAFNKEIEDFKTYLITQYKRSSSNNGKNNSDFSAISSFSQSSLAKMDEDQEKTIWNLLLLTDLARDLLIPVVDAYLQRNSDGQDVATLKQFTMRWDNVQILEAPLKKFIIEKFLMGNKMFLLEVIMLFKYHKTSSSLLGSGAFSHMLGLQDMFRTFSQRNRYEPVDDPNIFTVGFHVDRQYLKVVEDYIEKLRTSTSKSPPRTFNLTLPNASDFFMGVMFLDEPLDNRKFLENSAKQLMKMKERYEKRGNGFSCKISINKETLDHAEVEFIKNGIQSRKTTYRLFGLYWLPGNPRTSLSLKQIFRMGLENSRVKPIFICAVWKDTLSSTTDLKNIYDWRTSAIGKNPSIHITDKTHDDVKGLIENEHIAPDVYVFCTFKELMSMKNSYIEVVVGENGQRQRELERRTRSSRSMDSDDEDDYERDEYDDDLFERREGSSDDERNFSSDDFDDDDDDFAGEHDDDLDFVSSASQRKQMLEKVKRDGSVVVRVPKFQRRRQNEQVDLKNISVLDYFVMQLNQERARLSILKNAKADFTMLPWTTIVDRLFLGNYQVFEKAHPSQARIVPAIGLRAIHQVYRGDITGGTEFDVLTPLGSERLSNIIVVMNPRRNREVYDQESLPELDVFDVNISKESMY